MVIRDGAVKRVTQGLAIGTVAISLAACQMNNQTGGTAVGAITGALIGSQIGDGRGQIVAMVVGAAAGAWLGNELGRMLDEREQREMVRSTQESATTGQDNTWTNPNTGTTVRTSVVEESAETQQVQVPLKQSRIKTGNIPPFSLIGKQFQATTNANVRGGPSTDYEIVGSLQNGEFVDVIGQVDGTNWYIIGENGIGNGFVRSDLVQETQADSQVVLADPNAPSNDDDVVLVSAPATTQCRNIQQVVVLQDGTERSETVKACKGANGWETQSA